MAADAPTLSDVTPQHWPALRREWLDLFSRQVYGRTPSVDWAVSAREVDGSVVALDGGGSRRQVEVTVSDGERGVTIDVLLVLPAGRPAPVLLALNFYGNHTVTAAEDVRLPGSWVRESDRVPSEGNRASPAARGVFARDWPVAEMLASGFGLAAVYAGDIAPDDPDHVTEGILGLTQPVGDDPWGALGAWAWGLSCVRGVLADRGDVRADAIVAVGHSRMGKAALWAAAQDEGFAGVFSNGSGCGGAALSKHPGGEDVQAVTSQFPHWFTPGFARYAGREDELPVDQHQLLAAIAPRALYVASATEDDWADPTGEYLATAAALPVHRAVGGGRVGYHLRPGAHTLGPEDWEHALAFWRRHLEEADA